MKIIDTMNKAKENQIKIINFSATMYLLSVLLIVFSTTSKAQSIESLLSPDNSVMVELHQNQRGELHYSVQKNGTDIILPSRLGYLTHLGNLLQGKFTDLQNSSINTTWKPLYGQYAKVQNQCNQTELTMTYRNGLSMKLILRVYNEGVAFRYQFMKRKNMTDDLLLLKEYTEFNFNGNHKVWPIGIDPEFTSFQPLSLQACDFSLSPLVLETDKYWVALSEAAVYGMSYINLVNPDKKNTMKVDVQHSEVALPFETPWRVVEIANDAGGLIESSLVAKLNNPANNEKFPWVKPGKCLWDHRNLGDSINGFIYDKNEITYRRFIDFAADNSISYFLIDGGWYTPKGHLDSEKASNIQEVIKYANKKGVGILLYFDRSDRYENYTDLETALKTYKEWGAVGLKYGFLSDENGFDEGYTSADAYKINRTRFVSETRKIVELCAKYKLLVVFHDRVVPPGGEFYSWPNMICQEYGKAQQDGPAKPGKRMLSPLKAVTIPFTTGKNGPHDMTNGFFDLNNTNNRSKMDQLGIESTIVGEVARCIVNYSPLLILGDNGDVYSTKIELFDLIKSLPDKWDETQILEGYPGDYIIVARRKGNSWFVAGNTNEESRIVEIPLSFLGKGLYSGKLYLDAKDTHYQTRKETYEIKKLQVKSSQTLTIRMAPGGGFCLELTNRNY